MTHTVMQYLTLIALQSAGEAALLAVLEHRGLLDDAVKEQLAQVCADPSRRPFC